MTGQKDQGNEIETGIGIARGVALGQGTGIEIEVTEIVKERNEKEIVLRGQRGIC